MKDYNILLYYCYTHIENPEEFREQHHLYCIKNKLKGRIIIATEGINGTISGRQAQCHKYMTDLLKDSRFSHTEFKVESSDQHVFQKLNVRVKPEIVNSGFTQIDPTILTGKYLEPAEFKKLKDQDDVVLVDVRSNYEHDIGKFKKAITFDIEHFRDFPQQVKKLEPYKNKKIVTYCTGGIKCEKASAFLLEQGFENVYQLHGGIIKYGIEEGGEDFDGKCYVFDTRVVVSVNKVNPKVNGKCYVCEDPCNRMVNCANPECNNHIPICEKCGWELEGACSEGCKNHQNCRSYDGTGYYAKELNGYNPYRGLHRINNQNQPLKSHLKG